MRDGTAPIARSDTAFLQNKPNGVAVSRVQRRNNEPRGAPERASQLLLPIAGFGVLSNKEIAGRLAMSNRQYIELVDYTGRQIKKGKCGRISETEPPASAQTWTRRRRLVESSSG